jgi:hypothetical protein
MRQENAAVSTECCGVRCTPQGLAEVDSGSVVVQVQKDDVQALTLRHGLQAPHPVLQVLMGCALVALGYLPAAHLVQWFRRGGTFFTIEAFVIPFVFLGMSMVVSALRCGHFLEVEQRNDRKRLAFRPRPDPDDLERFVEEAERCLGLKITRRG